ncbi:MAG: hypothetical protein IJB21_00715 [Bacilli bacterium]|nr:hypothetical protein [Bacilli bacterium]
MDNNIDILLKEINSDIPKINPNLSSKIYEKAIEKKSKNIFPFFKKPLIITFTSVIAVFIVIFGVLNLGRNDNKNDIGNEPQFSPGGNLDVNNNQFVPNLSPTTQNTVFIDYHYTIYTETDEVVTLIINNKINYQKIYLKAYNLEINNVKINNGDVELKKVTIENETFFEIVLDNTNTYIHYLDLSFEKGTISNILKDQTDFEINFIMYINEVDSTKGYGYKFKIDNVFDLSEGNYL